MSKKRGKRGPMPDFDSPMKKIEFYVPYNSVDTIRDGVYKYKRQLPRSGNPNTKSIEFLANPNSVESD